MKDFLVIITVQIPYPKEHTYNVKASGPGTAVNRAFVLLRKDVPRKKLNYWRVSITLL